MTMDAAADAGADAGAGYPGVGGDFHASSAGTVCMMPGVAGHASPHHSMGEREGAEDLEREWDECLEGLLGHSTDGRTPRTPGTTFNGNYGEFVGFTGGSAASYCPPHTPSQAAGVRHIADWLRATAGAAGSEVRRAKLRAEHQELAREHRSERFAAEELQARLSTEMRELRDQCHEQGQTVGMLAQRLADARSAVTTELRSAAAVRSALGCELINEESQRRALEAARRGEEAELSQRVEAAEQQLQTMRGVRASLETQLRASARVQAELREHIAAERGGRSELEVAGERELVAWSERNDRVSGELRSRLQAEREETDTWRERTAREVSRLQQESAENSREESRLVEQLQSIRDGQSHVRARLRTEAVSWHYEVDALRNASERPTRNAGVARTRSGDTTRRRAHAGASGRSWRRNSRSFSTIPTLRAASSSAWGGSPRRCATSSARSASRCRAAAWTGRPSACGKSGTP